MCALIDISVVVLQVVGSPSSPHGYGEGLYFADGKRKVDYVLVFHQRRHSSLRSPASTSVSHDRLSVVSNGNFPASADSDAAAGRGAGVPSGEAACVGEVFMELGYAGGNESLEPADHEMRLMRQEFEANLQEAGLEIERDKEVRTPTSLHTDTNPALAATVRFPCFTITLFFKYASVEQLLMLLYVYEPFQHPITTVYLLVTKQKARNWTLLTLEARILIITSINGFILFVTTQRL